MTPADVIEMLFSGLTEMEANGYEVEQSAQSIGHASAWFGPDGEVPELLSVHGAEMMFQLPDGKLVKVKATLVPQPKETGCANG